MFDSWKCSLRVTRSDVKLLVTTPSGDVLKARLLPRPRHPRALLTLLEGLSLWVGGPLRVVLSVDESCRGLHDSMLFGDELWPAESSLVTFDVAAREGRRARLRGLGDFRALRAGRTA